MSAPAPPLRSFAQSLPMALLRARETVMRHFRPGLRRQGVTEQQWRILRALSERGPLEVSALAAATCLLPPSLSRIIPDMCARGLIARRAVNQDLRRVVVSIEPRGVQLIGAHAPESARVYELIARRFGAARLDQLVRLLAELEQVVALPQERPGSRERSQASRRAPR
jgi:homoprotocatechuate degradation regulator HpaR